MTTPSLVEDPQTQNRLNIDKEVLENNREQLQPSGSNNTGLTANLSPTTSESNIHTMDSSSSASSSGSSTASASQLPHPSILPRNVAKVIKGEIHNVWIVMRADARYASPLRFTEELHVDEHPVLQSLRELHDTLSLWEEQNQTVHDEDLVLDVVAYLTPFCQALTRSDISAPITGAALSALHKFVLYGFLTEETTPHASAGMTLLAKSLIHCTFEESSYAAHPVGVQTHKSTRLLVPTASGTVPPSVAAAAGVSGTSTVMDAQFNDEQVVLKLLNLAALVVRSSLQQQHIESTEDEDSNVPLLNPNLVVGLLETCLHVSHRAKRASSLLKSAAADALGQIVLQVFHADTRVSCGRATILSQLSLLTNPQHHPDATCVTSLTLLNIALETMPPESATQEEIAILQNHLCKNLLQLSTTQDLVILSLCLRVIFNLFQSIRNNLKVPLEIFLTSVHVRILESPTSTHEQQEVALESLLEFCREPALMQDLYLNYDCDVQCTNLFETIASTLGKVAGNENEGDKPLNVLNRLALEGILHIVDSIAKRCKGTDAEKPMPTSPRPRLGGREFSLSTDDEELTTEANLENDSSYDDLGDRWKTEENHKMLQERKRRKDLLSQAAAEFNRQHPEFVQILEDLELTSTPATPEEVASFLYTTPHLDKTQVGLYLSKGPAPHYPFHQQVRAAFIALYDFKGMGFARALRKLLSRFRLPGEAQCIDRLMEAFADELFQQQQNSSREDSFAQELEKDDENGETNDSSLSSPFRSADSVFTLAFSTILLNTDLHNPTLDDEKRMTIEQFIRNNRGINDGSDFPEDFLRELYEEIKSQEIQVRKELFDLVRRHAMEEDDGEIPAKHWNVVLSSKAEDVAEPFFTPVEAARRNDFQASVHERDMFLSISESAIKCTSSIFVRSSDDTLVIKALKGFRQMSKICVYFDLDEAFNEVLKILLGHGRDYIMSCIALEYAGYDSEQIMAAGPSAQVDDDDDRPSRPIPMSLNATDLVEELDEIEREANAATGSAAHRGLLSLDCGFTLIRMHPSKIRDAWPTLIECLCALRDARALPDRVIFLDDFADSHGNLLQLSPFAKQSQKRLDGYYRSLSDADQVRGRSWFGLPSLFKNDTRPPMRFDDTDSLASERELSSFSQSLMAVTRRARLEHVVLMRPKNLPMAKQTVKALLDAVDVYPYFDDPMFEQHAVYSLELALLALISNRDRAQELFPIFLSKFDTILKIPQEDAGYPESNTHLPTPFLMERVVVTILRACIHLYDIEEVRQSLFQSLQLLLGLPKNFTRYIADRIACGMAIFLSQKFALFGSTEEWNFIGDMLDRLAHFGPGRGFVFDGIANTVESQLTPSSQKGDDRAELSYEGSAVLTRLLLRFVFGTFQNDLSLTVPAMMCLENLYRHMVMLKRESEVVRNGNDSPVDLIPDKDLWQNVAVAFYSVCRSTDPSISHEGSDCFQRFVASTPIESLPDEKWIDILYLVVNKQPPLEAHETRVNTCTILGKTLLSTVAHLSQNEENWEDLTDIINTFALLVRENLREGRRGSVSPMFENTLHTVTFLSNHMVSDEFRGNKEFGEWVSDTLLSELEKVGAGGGSHKNVAATSKPSSNGSN